LCVATLQSYFGVQWRDPVCERFALFWRLQRIWPMRPVLWFVQPLAVLRYGVAIHCRTRPRCQWMTPHFHWKTIQMLVKCLLVGSPAPTVSGAGATGVRVGSRVLTDDRNIIFCTVKSKLNQSATTQ
jgi:hypothetical protein